MCYSVETLSGDGLCVHWEVLVSGLPHIVLQWSSSQEMSLEPVSGDGLSLGSISQ